ncbi:SAP domain containing protein [Gracilaria domingensis]|nr:SAP domain containing protein [Gracilaria domingensis]
MSPPPPRTPSRYNLRRRPSTATPVQNTPRMLRCLDAEEQLHHHPPSEPRLLRSAKKKRPVTADPSVRRPTPQPQRPSTAPLSATSPPPSPPNPSSLPSSQPLAAEPDITTTPVRRKRPSTAPPSDRVLRSASRSRQRDQSQEPIQRSSRKSNASQPQPPSRKRLTARARAFLPHPLTSDKPEAVDKARGMATRRGRSRSRSNTRSRPPQAEVIVPKRERSQPRSQVRTIRTRSQSTANAANKASTENDISAGAEGLGDTMRRLFHGAQLSQSSSPDFSKWSYHDLVEECKKNGLPCRGKKDDVVSRLQRFHSRSAGALARRIPIETKSGVKSRSTKSDRQETLESNVSRSNVSSEREKVITPAGDEGKGYEQGSTCIVTEAENKADVAAPQQHIGVQGDGKPPLNSELEDHNTSEHRNITEDDDNAAKILSERGRNHGDSPGSKEDEKSPEQRNCLGVPFIEEVEDQKQLSSTENRREQVVRLDTRNDHNKNSTQQRNPTDREDSPAQQVRLKEFADFEAPLNVNEQEQPSMHTERYQSPKEHTSDLEQNETPSFQNKPSEPERADPPPSQVNPAIVPLSQPSVDGEIKAQSPHETPVPSGTRAVVKAVDLAKESIQEPQDAKSDDGEIEDATKYSDGAVDDLTNSVQTVCQRINNVGAIQFEPAKEHTTPVQTSKDPEENEFQFGNRRVVTEAKDGSSLHRVSCGGGQASLPECESREEQANEIDVSAEQEAASQSPLQSEPQETAMREIFSRWKRPPIERKEEVAQTPDVIDLDAESDGNDDDEEEDSRNGNSDSNENSADESQRPETVVAADDDDDEEDDNDNRTPRREDVNGNKLPDTDEDNDEDEDDDDDDSNANDDSPRDDACEFLAVDGEGPHPMDVTFSEQGEERQGVHPASPKRSISSVKANAHDTVNSEDDDAPKASPLGRASLLPKRDVVERKAGEQFKTVNSTERDRDDVIDLQEDSRMGEDEEEDEELDYADDTVKLNEGPGELRENTFSNAEKGKRESVSRGRSEESDSEIALDPSEICGREKLVSNEAVESSPRDDTVEEPQASLHDFEEEVNDDYFGSPDVKSKVMDLSADEKEDDDEEEDKTVALKGIIKPELKSDDMSLSGEEDVDESDEEKAVAQKSLIVPDDARAQEDQDERGDEMQLSNSQETPETPETEEPRSVNIMDHESTKNVGVLVSPTESSKRRSRRIKTIDEESNDDLGDFSESPLPSPNPPRNHVEGPQGDVMLKSIDHVDSEDFGDSVLEHIGDSELPEKSVQDDKSEVLEENYPSSDLDLSRAEQDRSREIVERGSDEEQSQSEELSSPVEDPAHADHERRQNPSSRGSTPEVHEFTEKSSSDPGQDRGGNETPGFGQSRHGRVETSRGSSPEAHGLIDNPSSEPGRDEGENGCRNEEPPNVICIISSDDDEAVAENSAGAVLDKIADRNETSEPKKLAINEELPKDEEDKGARAMFLPISDVHLETHADRGLVSSNIGKEHPVHDGFDDDRIHHPLSGTRNRSSPLPSDLVQKTSQTASRSRDISGFPMPLMQRSDSAFSASLKVRTDGEEYEKLPPLNSMFLRKQKAGPSRDAKAPRDCQTSTRLTSDLMQGRILNDNNECKLFERDALPRQQNPAEEQASPKGPHAISGKRPFELIQEEVHQQDQRPRKIRKKDKMVEFVPIPTPEDTIQAFGQQQMMNETQNSFQREQKSSSVLQRLSKIQGVDQSSSLSFRLPPLTATLGHVYNPLKHQSKPLMFRQGSISSKPKRSLRGRTTRGVLEYDKMSFLEESRRRLEAHKRRAPSLQSSQTPFDTAPAKNLNSRAIPREATDHRQPHGNIPAPTKRVTFQTEIPPSKRRKSTSSR